MSGRPGEGARDARTNRKPEHVYRVIGLMSGTSLDGIDAAYMETDGETRAKRGPAVTVAYDASFRSRLKSVLGGKAAITTVQAVEQELTERHAQAVALLCTRHSLDAPDLIGFHGHTILHDPAAQRTWQIGDGARLAKLTGIQVAADFRRADVAAGGEGAPFVPVFHRALAADLEKPLAVVNIGGVANVTWIGPKDGELLAFDTGPGNAPLDDWALVHTGRPVDIDGALALSGRIDQAFVSGFLNDPYFARVPPKSLDRDHFRGFVPQHLSAADGAATLTECIAATIAQAQTHFPQPARQWLVTGGGRRNPALMSALARQLGVVPQAAEAFGFDGDALEAQAFAYLAVRSLRGLPLSFPGTTGVPQPQCGGTLFQP